MKIIRSRLFNMFIGMNNPFTAAAASFAEFRHMEMYNGLPAQLLHHLHPQFLHPGLSPFGNATGAFRPLVELKSFQTPSAFAPPTKCLKITTDNSNDINVSQQQSSNLFSTNPIQSSPDLRTYSNHSHGDSLSPVSLSMSPPSSQPQQQHPSTESTPPANANDASSNQSGASDTVKQEHNFDGSGPETSSSSSSDHRCDSVNMIRRENNNQNTENQRMFRGKSNL